MNNSICWPLNPKAIFASSAVKRIIDIAKATGKLIMVKNEKCLKTPLPTNIVIDKEQHCPITKGTGTTAGQVSLSVEYHKTVNITRKVAKQVFPFRIFNPVQIIIVQQAVKMYNDTVC